MNDACLQIEIVFKQEESNVQQSRLTLVNSFSNPHSFVKKCTTKFVVFLFNAVQL